MALKFFIFVLIQTIVSFLIVIRYFMVNIKHYGRIIFNIFCSVHLCDENTKIVCL